MSESQLLTRDGAEVITRFTIAPPSPAETPFDEWFPIDAPERTRFREIVDADERLALARVVYDWCRAEFEAVKRECDSEGSAHDRITKDVEARWGRNDPFARTHEALCDLICLQAAQSLASMWANAIFFEPGAWLTSVDEDLDEDLDAELEAMLDGPIVEFTEAEDATYAHWVAKGASADIVVRMILRDREAADRARAEYERQVAEEEHKQAIREDATENRRKKRAERDAEPIIMHTREQLLEKTSIEYWVEGIIPKGTVGILAAAPGMGKSALVLEMAARSTNGQPFLGEFECAPASWLIVAGEGFSGYGPRIHALESAHGLLIPSERFRLISAGVSLSNEHSIESLCEIVRQNKIDVVVLDTLSQLSTLSSEDNAAELKVAIRQADRIRDAREGVTVIIVHHTVKSTDKVRGSGAIRGNTRWTWKLKGTPDALTMTNKIEDDGKANDMPPLKISGLSLVGAFGSVVVERADIPAESAALKRGHIALNQMSPGRQYSTAEMYSLMREAIPTITDITIKRDLKQFVDAGQLTNPSRGIYEFAGFPVNDPRS